MVSKLSRGYLVGGAHPQQALLPKGSLTPEEQMQIPLARVANVFAAIPTGAGPPIVLGIWLGASDATVIQDLNTKYLKIGSAVTGGMVRGKGADGIKKERVFLKMSSPLIPGSSTSITKYPHLAQGQPRLISRKSPPSHSLIHSFSITIRIGSIIWSTSLYVWK